MLAGLELGGLGLEGGFACSPGVVVDILSLTVIGWSEGLLEVEVDWEESAGGRVELDAVISAGSRLEFKFVLIEIGIEDGDPWTGAVGEDDEEACGAEGSTSIPVPGLTEAGGPVCTRAKSRVLTS